MPVTQKRTVTILLEQCTQAEERCDGYRDELIAAISDIIESERAHRVSRTDIQKRITDKCNAVAVFLAGKQGRGTPRGREG